MIKSLKYIFSIETNLILLALNFQGSCTNIYSVRLLKTFATLDIVLNIITI